MGSIVKLERATRLESLIKDWLDLTRRLHAIDPTILGLLLRHPDGPFHDTVNAVFRKVASEIAALEKKKLETRLAAHDEKVRSLSDHVHAERIEARRVSAELRKSDLLSDELARQALAHFGESPFLASDIMKRSTNNAGCADLYRAIFLATDRLQPSDIQVGKALRKAMTMPLHDVAIKRVKRESAGYAWQAVRVTGGSGVPYGH